MKKIIISGVVGLIAALSNTTGAYAQEYRDSEDVADWAKPYVEQLTEMGCYTGYADNQFKPQWSITREELAVVLAKCLETVEANNNKYTQEQVALLKKDIEVLQARLEAQDKKLQDQASSLEMTQAEMFKKRDNWVGVGIQNGLGGDSGFNIGAVSIDSKLRVLNLSDKLGVSFRPGYNTANEAYAGVSLDYDASDNITLYAGAGAAVSVADDFFGVLTQGKSGDVTPFAQTGLELDLSRTVGIYTDVKVPLEDVTNDLVITSGIYMQF